MSEILLSYHYQTKMFFHPPDYVYIAYYNGDAIVLNLKTDQYSILSKRLSEDLHTAITIDLHLANGKYNFINKDLPELPSDFGASIETLIAADILLSHLKEMPSSRPLALESIPGGASNIDWRLSPGDITGDVQITLIFEAYMTLIKVYLIIKMTGFHGLIKAMKKRDLTCVMADNLKYRSLITSINKASFYFPVRVKCLEWSATLAFMALKRSWRCNLEIGVQNAPFAAHAWVSANDQVIADAQDLPRVLSVILSEPFQRT
jgi:hypothetical protein